MAMYPMVHDHMGKFMVLPATMYTPTSSSSRILWS